MTDDKHVSDDDFLVPTPEELEEGKVRDRSRRRERREQPEGDTRSGRRGFLRRLRPDVGQGRTEVPAPRTEPTADIPPMPPPPPRRSPQWITSEPDPTPTRDGGDGPEPGSGSGEADETADRVASWVLDEPFPGEDQPPGGGPPPKAPPASGAGDDEPSNDEGGEEEDEEAQDETDVLEEEEREEEAEAETDEPPDGQAVGQARRLRRVSLPEPAPPPPEPPPARSVPPSDEEPLRRAAAELGHELGEVVTVRNPDKRVSGTCVWCGRYAEICFQVEDGWSDATAVSNYRGDALRLHCSHPRPPTEDGSGEEDEPPRRSGSGTREPRRPKPSSGEPGVGLREPIGDSVDRGLSSDEQATSRRLRDRPS